MTHSIEDDIRLLVGLDNVVAYGYADAYHALLERDVWKAVNDDFRIFTAAALQLIRWLSTDLAQLCETTPDEVLQSYLRRIDELNEGPEEPTS